MNKRLRKPFLLEKSRVNIKTNGDNQRNLKVLGHFSVLLEIHEIILPTKFLVITIEHINLLLGTSTLALVVILVNQTFAEKNKAVRFKTE